MDSGLFTDEENPENPQLEERLMKAVRTVIASNGILAFE